MIFTVTNKSGTNTDGKARLGISVLEDLKDYKYEERTYDGLNRMTKVRNTNGITEYKYRPDGLRLTKQTGGKEILYAWNGNQIIAEIEDSSREKTNVYSYGRERIRKGVYFDDVEYYIYNAHGNVVQLAGETQYKHYDDEFEWIDKNLKKTYEYDAFGNELNPDENDTNHFRYCGEYYDKETENIYLRARNYNPASGVFTTEDPARDGLNWYSYCNNNPIMFVDPSGKITKKEQEMFEDGEMAPMAYTYLMELTYDWYLADTQEEKDMLHKLAEDFRITNYTTTNGVNLGVDKGIEFMNKLPSTIVNEEEHFFRNTLNIEFSYDDLIKINQIVPDFLKWELLSAEMSELHQNSSIDNSNIKFVSKDGHFEAVYDKNGILLSSDNCPEDMGTYNYANPNDYKSHFLLDIVPYFVNGNVKNSSERPLTNTILHYYNKMITNY